MSVVKEAVRRARAVVTRELPPPEIQARDFKQWAEEFKEQADWRKRELSAVKKNGYTVVDLMSGMGGSSTGLELAGFTIIHASNHWSTAVQGHQVNHPDTDHSQSDVSKVEPSFFPPADVLWASPECKNHSPAKGKKRDGSDLMLVDEWGRRLDESLWDEAEAEMDPKELLKNEEDRARRSRAMMEDVVRIAEYNAQDRGKPYKYMVIENVPAVTDWIHFAEWRRRLDVIGYDIEVMSLNSSHAHGRDLEWEGVAQSRDRVYIVATLKGLPKPDLEVRPPCYCFNCDSVVEGKKVWKQTPKTKNKPKELVSGVYGDRGQYYFKCTTSGCGQKVEPYQKPAAAVLKLDDTGRTIGDWIDSKKPPAPATLERIRAGIEKYMLAILYSTGGREHPARPGYEPMRTLTARHEDGVAQPPPGFTVPFGGTWRSQASPTWEPHPTFTNSQTDGMVLSPEVLTTKRGGGSRGRGYSVNEPLGTVTQAAGRNFDLTFPPQVLMRNNTARGDDAQMSTSVMETGRTLTTAGHQSLVGPPSFVQPLAWVSTYNSGGGNSMRHISEPLTTLTTVERQRLVQYYAHARAELRDLVAANPGDRIKVTEEFLRACTSRMLRIDEIAEFTGMPNGYVMVGTKRDQAAGMGNAVTPPAARLIGERIAESLDAHRMSRSRSVMSLA